jgi:hypothetical protein
MATGTLNVLRPGVWAALSRRLDEATHDNGGAASRDVMARPLQLLALMAADAPGALGNDVLAAERLRMLLHLAAPFCSRVDEARALVETAAGARKASEPELAYEPGVIDHGALALLALAAMRCAPPGSEALFIRTIHGLALSAAPGEVLGRLLPRMPEPAGLSVILDTLYLLDTVGAALNAPVLRPFAADPAERGRWRCLARLLEKDLAAAVSAAASRAKTPHGTPQPWDAAGAVLLDDIQPQHAEPGQPVVLTGKLESLGPGPKLREGVRAVFASADGPPLPAKVLGLKAGPKASELRLAVPVGAQPGWVGFSDDALLRASNEFRAALRATLPMALSARGCLRGAEVAAELIVPLGVPDPGRPGMHLAIPPRTAGNRWAGPASWSSKDENAASPVATGDAVAASSAARHHPRARIAAMRPLQASHEAPLYLGRPLQIEVLIEPPDASVDLELRLDPPPPDNKPLQLQPHAQGERFRFTVPQALVHDQMALTAVMKDGTEPLEHRTLGPLSVNALRAAQVVFVRPQVIKPGMEPIAVDTRDRWLHAIGEWLGLEIEAFELPWVDDELAVLMTPVASGDDARVPGLLEALSRRAMLTPRLESALWVLLMPDAESGRALREQLESAAAHLGGDDVVARVAASGRGFARAAQAVAAHAVAVADTLGLPELFSAVYPPHAKVPGRPAPTSRLRIIGSLDAEGVTLESVREELRGAGPGAPLDTGIVAVSLDRNGRELLVAKVTCLREERPALLAMLLPVSPEVAQVELRRGHRLLERIVRPAGEPLLELAVLGEDGEAGRSPLRWQFTHTRNVRPDLSLWLSARNLTTEVLRFDACDTAAYLRLTRYGRVDALTLTASDGWNTAVKRLVATDGKPAAVENPTPVQIRRLSDDLFFADVPSSWQVQWTLDGGSPRGSHRTLWLDPGERGTLRLEASGGPEQRALVDERYAEVR